MSTVRPFGDHRYVGDKRAFRVHDLEHETEECDIDGIVDAEKVMLFGPDAPAEARNRGYRPCPLCRA